MTFVYEENVLSLARTFSIVEADTPETVPAVKTFFAEYSKLLAQYEDPGAFEVVKELESLPEPYSPPNGKLFLAYVGNEPAGCVGIRKLDPRICEMKRLFAAPHFRGKGVGRHLVENAMTEARDLGYRKMRLDTVPPLADAIHLYQSIGFRPIERYNDNSYPGAMFMEIDL